MAEFNYIEVAVKQKKHDISYVYANIYITMYLHYAEIHVQTHVLDMEVVLCFVVKQCIGKVAACSGHFRKF